MKPKSSSRGCQGGGASTAVFAGFAVVALFFLLTEHRAHLYGWLPYILLAACPLMHLFHGHGGHKPSGTPADEAQRETATSPSTSPEREAPVPPVAHHHQ